MSIPEKFRNRFVYHFTLLDNLAGILEHGLLSTNEKGRLGIEHENISLKDIQKYRSTKSVPCGPGGVVHDYVPLYFCKRSSMLLYILLNKWVDQQFIIYFEFPIQIMNQYPCVFCDAAANEKNSSPKFYLNPSDLENLNWKAIDDLKWSMPNERLKDERMAELLVYKN